jgi:uncharacterized peroxidase-related enzyme
VTHAHFLRSQGAEYRAAGRALANGDIALAELSPTDLQMLAYAEKLTREPASVSDDDIRRLRDVGFSDAQVWEMTFTTSIFAMFNRMADAFGLQPPEQLLTALERP